MTEQGYQTKDIENLLSSPDLVAAFENDAFRRFLDAIPIAIAVAQMGDNDDITYANPAFEAVCGINTGEIIGKHWQDLFDQTDITDDARLLGTAITESSDFVGTFRVGSPERGTTLIDAYANIIEDEDGVPIYRLAALIDVSNHDESQREELERQLRDKDTLLLEVQHRVRNNLQMITSLIRLEARAAKGKIDTAPFDRLAGRIDSIKLLYAALTNQGANGEIDLGTYLSEIASSVLHSHAVEGIRLDLKVDSYPVSVNVAMPVGLVVNELLTNALKYAFQGRDGGIITLHSLAGDSGCEVLVADDGVGLPPDGSWPKAGKLGALIVQSLRTNAKAKVEVESAPDKGMRVKILFSKSAASPKIAG